MKPRHLLLVGGLLVSGGLVLFGDNSPSGGIAEPVARAPRAAATPPAKQARPGAARPVPSIAVLLPRPQADAARPPSPLFARQSWVPPVVAAATRGVGAGGGAEAAADAAPTAPPLPFTYLGKKSEDGVWEVYLARREQSFVARAKAVIDGQYRVDAISATTMSFTYLPLDQVQRLSLGPND